MVAVLKILPNNRIDEWLRRKEGQIDLYHLVFDLTKEICTQPFGLRPKNHLSSTFDSQPVRPPPSQY